MSDLDLNALRDHVHKVQKERAESGRSTSEQETAVFVDPAGTIKMGNREKHRDLSEVPIEKFSSFDLGANRRFVSTKMPNNTREISDPELMPTGVGWAFEITTELDDRFAILIAYDGRYYQGYVLEPPLEAHHKDTHRFHLFPPKSVDDDQNRICFGHDYGGGMPSLESAYAKSVIWANGFSIARRGYEFPWNWDQERV